MFKLVCVVPFHDRATNSHVAKGAQITNQDDVARHMTEREKRFVKVTMSAAEEAAEKSRQTPKSKPASSK